MIKDLWTTHGTRRGDPKSFTQRPMGLASWSIHPRRPLAQDPLVSCQVDAHAPSHFRQRCQVVLRSHSHDLRSHTLPEGRRSPVHMHDGSHESSHGRAFDQDQVWRVNRHLFQHQGIPGSPTRPRQPHDSRFVVHYMLPSLQCNVQALQRCSVL